MLGREAVGLRVAGDVVQAQRLGLVDEQAQEPVAGGQGTDLLDLDRVHAVVHERAQPLPRGRVQHAQGGVVRPGQLPGDRHDPGEHSVEAEVSGHGDDRVQEQAQPGLLVDRSVDPGEDLPQQDLELDFRRRAISHESSFASRCAVASPRREASTCAPSRADSPY